MKTVRVRVAPSPTGDPHVGTAYIGLFDQVFARSQNGKFILRIEDTDRTRSTPESEQAILESLRWVGLQWDEGPDVGGDYGPYRQSERSEIYRKHAGILLESGRAYRCFCTPERLAEMRDRRRKEKLPPKYDGRCRELTQEQVEENIAADKPFVVRLRIPPSGHVSFTDKIRGLVQIATEQIDDQVLLKSDGFPTYHLANVVDDHLMEITHVIRAEEWISSTPKHVLLYEAFGWEMPEFIHMPLLRNKDKSKISKRKNPVSLLWYKEQGYMPEALLNFLGNMGWSFSDGREIFSLDEMVADFSWDRVGTTGPIFDVTKLDWMNGMYVRQLSPEELTRRLLDTALAGRDIDRERLLQIAPLIQERITKFNADEFDAMSDFFFIGADDLEYDPGLLVPKKTEPAAVGPALQKMRERFDAIRAWETQPMEDAIRALADEIGWKAGSVFMCVRIAVTGRKATPPLLESMIILGKDESLKRMDNAIEKARLFCDIDSNGREDAMRVYLVQHGEARSKEEDPDRHLTDQGAADAERVAGFLKPLALTAAAVWHSGKPRARQTADILASALSLREGVFMRRGLAPNDPVDAVADELNEAQDDVMIVGHLPFLCRLASLMVTGSESCNLVAFRNAGVVCLERDDSGEWLIRWIILPQILP